MLVAFRDYEGKDVRIKEDKINALTNTRSGKCVIWSGNYSNVIDSTLASVSRSLPAFMAKAKRFLDDDGDTVFINPDSTIGIEYYEDERTKIWLFCEDTSIVVRGKVKEVEHHLFGSGIATNPSGIGANGRIWPRF